MFSLPGGSGKLAQRFDVVPKFRSERVDFGAETKIFPAISLLAGKIALAGVHARRVFARAAVRPPTTCFLPRTQAMRGSTFSVISMKD